MNVAFDPWVPVVAETGGKIFISLRDVFAKGEQLTDLAVRPHERVSLMRLFLSIAHAALDGPKDYDEWCEVPKHLSLAAIDYLIKWKNSFEVFHPKKPWLQIAEITKKIGKRPDQSDTSDWTPVSKLNFSFATGNNTTLFDHEGMNDVRNISLNDAVLSMLSYQCFSTGGLISQVFWNGKQTGKSSKDSPCVSASMVHGILRGDNLFATIILNLPTYENIRQYYGNRPLGRPIWEMMPSSFADSARVKNATSTYLGRLVPLTRLIQLNPNGERMLLGDGLFYPSYYDGFPPEPTATAVVRQIGKTEKRSLISYRPEKSLWRELAAITVLRQATGIGGPLSLRNIGEKEDHDLIVSALARDQATVVDIKESVFHIPSRLLSNQGNSIYDAEVKYAENQASRLGWAIEGYRNEIDGGWEGRLKGAGPSKGSLKFKLHSVATTYFWTAVEKNLPVLMAHIEAIGTEKAVPLREKWRKMLFATACEAYRTSCGQDTPRQIRAFTKGWQRLIKINDGQESNMNK
ncbi:MAG: type I-E CRISPR-associated protein Cse1/CasA [Candidatus Aminicenantes bacterium]|nr:type I-E CRISPR-associated protein Cse1/CasA [Candidatus Aminicenantes bacterium]